MGPSTIHPEARAELLKMVEYYMDKDVNLVERPRFRRQPAS
jgi:hypothetical protein